MLDLKDIVKETSVVVLGLVFSVFMIGVAIVVAGPGDLQLIEEVKSDSWLDWGLCVTLVFAVFCAFYMLSGLIFERIAGEKAVPNNANDPDSIFEKYLSITHSVLVKAAATSQALVLCFVVSSIGANILGNGTLNDDQKSTIVWSSLGLLLILSLLVRSFEFKKLSHVLSTIGVFVFSYALVKIWMLDFVYYLA